jgi:hypothetical protein
MPQKSKLFLQFALLIILAALFSINADPQRRGGSRPRSGGYSPPPTTYDPPTTYKPPQYDVPDTYTNYPKFSDETPNNSSKSLTTDDFSSRKEESEEARISDKGYTATNKASFEFLESEAAKAVKFIGGASKEKSEKKIYLTKVYIPGSWEFAFYAHTNYKPTSSYEDKYLMEYDVSSLKSLLKKTAGEPDPDSENVAYYIEEKLFAGVNPDQFLESAGLGNKSTIYVIGSDGTVRRLVNLPENGKPRRLLPYDEEIENLFVAVDNPNRAFLRGDDGQLTRLIKYNKYLFIRPEAEKKFIEQANSPIAARNFRILNLFTDKTQEVVEQNFSEIKIDFDLEKTRTEAQNLQFLENHFRLHRNTTIFVIGHVDRATGDYLIEDAASNVIFRISPEKLKETAAKNEIKIIDLSCESALRQGSGTINTVYSVDVANRLREAVKAKTISEFFGSLSSQNLPMVIDDSMIDNVEMSLKLTLLKDINDSFDTVGAGARINDEIDRNKSSKNKNKEADTNTTDTGKNDKNKKKAPARPRGKESENRTSIKPQYKYVEAGKLAVTFPRSVLTSSNRSQTSSFNLFGNFVDMVPRIVWIGGVVVLLIYLRRILKKEAVKVEGFSGSVPAVNNSIMVVCPFCMKDNVISKKDTGSAVCWSCKRPLF